MSRSRIVIALSAGITSLSLAGAASAEGPGQDSSGAVYVLSNQSTANSVLVYRRDSNENLTFSSSVPTGGAGAGTDGDPPGSHGWPSAGSGLLHARNPRSTELRLFA